MDSVPFVILTVLLCVGVLGQVALWAVLVQVVRQQGRILLRLDELQQNGHPADGRPLHADELPVIAAPVQPLGLSVGSPIGDFLLPDLAGQLVGPRAWRGQRVLLIHWSTTCGFCDLIAPEVARLETDLRAQRVRLVLVSYGDPPANRLLAEEHGLACPILLQPDMQPIAAFAQLGTPVAYVLDEMGRVAEPLIAGADQVLDAARRLVARPDRARVHLPGEQPLSESRIERGGLKAGARAPLFSLPDVQGQTVALRSYRGRPVLLVFTDPHCGPCDALGPDLAKLGRRGQEAGLGLLVIGRGPAEENRRKAEQYEFTFPVLLQKRWEVSKAYGIFATPVGFLIDEQGAIVRDVAMGPDAIVALAAEWLAVGTRKELENGRAVR